MRKLIRLIPFLAFLTFNVSSAQVVDTTQLIQTIDSLLDLANKSRLASKINEVYPIIEKAKGLAEEELGKTHEKYAQCLQLYGVCKHLQSEYFEAEKYYNEARLILVNNYDISKNTSYAITLSALASLQRKLGRFDQTDKLFNEVIPLFRNLFGSNSLNYAKILENYSNFLTNFGEYRKAESNYFEAKKIIGNIEGKNSKSYHQINSNLAVFYRQIGQYSRADSLYSQTASVIADSIGKESREYAIILSNWGNLKIWMKQFDDAEKILLEAEDVAEKLLSREQINLYSNPAILTSLYLQTQEYKKAEKLCLKYLPFIEEAYGSKNNRDYISILNNLAYAKAGVKEFDEAERLFLETKDRIKLLLGEKHPDYFEVCNNLLQVYWVQNDLAKFKPLFVEANSLLKNSLVNATKFLSEEELNEFIKRFREYFNKYFSYAYHLSKTDDLGLNSTCYNNLILQKDFILNTTIRLRNIIKENSQFLNEFKQLKSLSFILANEYARPISQQKNVEKLETEIENIEKELVKQASGFNNLFRQVTWKEIQSKLSLGEVAIEFFNYRLFDEALEPTDSIIYAAMVLRYGYEKPEFVVLGEEEEINSIIKRARGRNIRNINKLYSHNSEGEKLNRFIFKPLNRFLVNANRIYFSPSGLLNRINIGAIPISSQKTFSDQTELKRIGSTRQLAIQEDHKIFNSFARIVGGVRYERINKNVPSDNKRSKEVSDAFMLAAETTSLKSNNSLEPLEYLEYSLKEVEAIASLLQNNDYEIELVTGHAATEESVLALGAQMRSPKVLHLATHGYFFEKDFQIDGQSKHNLTPGFKLSKLPLIRSGLYLAGANSTIVSKSRHNQETDGILTAFEISQLDLSNTELVVLSACDTGLGDIEGNEGVYGLQRAFKIAGVKYILMSLWKINDVTTSEFMIEFYNQWLSSNQYSIPKAFKMTKEIMRKKYPDYAFNWAGWILVE